MSTVTGRLELCPDPYNYKEMMIMDKLLIMLSGSLSRRESRKDLRALLLYDNMYVITIYSLLMLQDYLKMLVFVRLGLSPSILAFCKSVQRYSPIPLIPVHK